MKLYIPTFIFLLLPYLLFAQKQDLDFEHLNLEDGLSQSSVYAILQDSKGFMWFGTQDGLNLYDAYNFTVFKKDAGSKSKISDNWINCLAEDTKGYIWIGTQKGLNRFDREKRDFKQFLNDSQNAKSLQNNEITALFVGNKNQIFVGTAEGLDLYQSRTQSFRHIHLNKEKKTLRINTINASETHLFVGTSEGLYFSELSDLRQWEKISEDNSKIANHHIKSIHINQKGKLWLGTANGLAYLNPEKRLIKNYTINEGLSNGEINDIYADNTGNLWLATFGGGLNKFNLKTKTFRFYFEDSQNPKTISTNFLFTLYGDRTGTIWIGTYTAGIDKLDFTRKKFRNLFRANPIQNSISSNNVKSFYEDHKGILWVATYGGGLNRYNLRTKNFEVYKHKPANPQSLPIDDVQYVYEDSKNTLWVGTKGGGLSRFDRKNETFKTYRFDENNPKSISSDKIRIIYEDSQNNLWIGTNGGGLNLFLPESQTFRRFMHNPKRKGSLQDDVVYALFEDNKRNLWVGTRNAGLHRLDRSTGVFTNYQHNDKDPKSISHNKVMSIYQDKKGRLWIGTSGGALNQFDYKTQTFKRINESDGLPNDVAYGILEDEAGNLWISTNKGISKFNPDKKTFTNFDHFDGLQSDEFNGGAFHKGQKTGKLYFGGIDGFNAFYPHRIKLNTYSPPPIVNKFLIFNDSVAISPNSVLQKDISETQKIVLDYDQSVFSFEFTSLNYTRSSKNRYKYRLRGFEGSKWTEVDASRRFVTYTNLNPGTYFFEVKASNNDGIWNKKATVVKIKVLPPFWMTWWFRILVVLLIASVAFVWYRRRMARIERQRRVLEEEVQRQTAQINQQKEEIEATLENLKETQSQLLESDKMASLGQLTAGIAHEINNPINFVSAGIGSLDANIQDILEVLESYEEVSQSNVKEKLGKIKELKEDIEYEEVLEEVEDLVQSIKRGAERTTEIVKGLRTFSRLDEDDLKQADLHENLDATLSILRNQYKDKVEIIKNYNSIPNIDCYPGKLNQVFMNIISNAIQAIEEKGTITVSTSKPAPNEVAVSIRDTGIGMSEEVKARVFEPFFTTKDVGKGTGLGMSITHSIIEKHNARIEVESELGKGTEFTIYLPIHHKEG